MSNTPPRGGEANSVADVIALVSATLPELIEVLQTDITVNQLAPALIHRSWSYEHGGIPTNERLEFLGDAVLGMIVTEELFNRNPTASEGNLARYRSAIVNSKALADVARTLGLGNHLLLGRGESASGGADKDSILADSLEAVIGAVFVSLGLPAATQLILRLFDHLIDSSSDLGAGLDWKTSLQELAAVRHVEPPEYLITESGPDHDKRFTAQVKFGEQVLGLGEGRSKKAAEQQAAASAFALLTNA